jgi:lipid II:glycine glycyltransferase (peptidoglycan interpeptide bridge formation enzyme)
LYFFSSIFEFSQEDKVAVFGTYLDDKLIASRFCMMNQHILYDWYAGHREDFNPYYPNDFIIHHIFEWAQKKGVSTFDFGGAGNNTTEYGVREFKLKFGGQLTEYGRNEIVFNPLKYSLGKFGFKIKKLIFK